MKPKKNMMTGIKDKDPYQKFYDLKETVPKGQGFFVEHLLQAGEHRLVKLRCPLGTIQWNGDWADGKPCWNSPEVIQAFNELHEEEREVIEDDDFSMWMSEHEAVSFFKNLTVCRIKNWNETRLPGKFVRVSDMEDSSYEAVLSKWYYQVEVPNPSDRS